VPDTGKASSMVGLFLINPNYFHFPLWKCACRRNSILIKKFQNQKSDRVEKIKDF
jgi:hypothetical protein